MITTKENTTKQTLINELENYLSRAEIEGFTDEIVSNIRKIKETLDTINMADNKAEVEKMALNKYLKGGELDTKESRVLQMSTLNGATINMVIHKDILEKLEEEVQFLNYAKVFNNKGDLRIIKEKSLGLADIVAELQELQEKNIDLDNVTLKSYKIGALCKVTVELANSTSIDLNKYVADILIRRISRTLNQKFIQGTGVNEPQGILQANNVHTFRDADITIENLVEMQEKINSEYITDKCFWIVNRKTYNYLSSMTDASGNTYMKYSFDSNGKLRSFILGIEILIDNNMQDMTVGNKFIALVNLQEGYAINMPEEITVKHLEEYGFSQGFELYCGFVLVDGKILNEECVVVGTL